MGGGCWGHSTHGLNWETLSIYRDVGRTHVKFGTGGIGKPPSPPFQDSKPHTPALAYADSPH